MPTLGRDLLSGFIGAMVQIAYCISFGALIFQEPIAAGFPLGLAALLMGTVVTGVIVAPAAWAHGWNPAVPSL